MCIALRNSFVLLLFAWTAAIAAPATDKDMKVDLVQDLNWQDHHFAMTNWFYKHKWNDPAAQIAILAERGYDSVLLSLKDDPRRWKTLPAYLAALKKHNMRLTAIHARFYIEDGTYPKVIKDNLPLLKGTKVVLVPSVGSRKKMDRKDPKAVEMAVKILREMSSDAKKHGLGGVAPYMHIGNWIETIEDNVRIAKAVDRRNVGVMFHLHHWQAVGNRDLDKLREDLIKAKPYLMIVVIQGTDKDKATHKILGEGSFDMAPLVRTLREIDYQGPLGTMGYTQSGDIPGKLNRAYRAWEQIKRKTLKPIVAPLPTQKGQCNRHGLREYSMVQTPFGSPERRLPHKAGLMRLRGLAKGRIGRGIPAGGRREALRGLGGGDAVIELAHEADFEPTRPIRDSLRISRQFVREALGW